MAVCRDAFHHLRGAFRHPAENEKRRFHVPLVQNRQNLLRVCDDAALVIRPFIIGNVLFERFDLKIVLNIEREGVQHRSSP